MSILIKGMERPTAGTIIAVYKIDGKLYATKGLSGMLYPLLPVPPHGRLIDADKADSRFTPDFTELSAFQCGWNAAMKRVCEDAPTIIPEDKKE